jgi:hypothetical protein
MLLNRNCLPKTVLYEMHVIKLIETSWRLLTSWRIYFRNCFLSHLLNALAHSSEILYKITCPDPIKWEHWCNHKYSAKWCFLLRYFGHMQSGADLMFFNSIGIQTSSRRTLYRQVVSFIVPQSKLVFPTFYFPELGPEFIPRNHYRKCSRLWYISIIHIFTVYSQCLTLKNSISLNLLDHGCIIDFALILIIFRIYSIVPFVEILYFNWRCLVAIIYENLYVQKFRSPSIQCRFCVRHRIKKLIG